MRRGRAKKRNVVRGMTVVGVALTALTIAACAGDDETEPVEEAVEEESTSEAAADSTEEDEQADDTAEFSGTVVPGSGDGFSAGYLSGGDSIPFVRIVTDSVLEYAEIAGLDIVPCDGDLDPATALECARSFAVQDLDAVANWQFSADASPEVCEAYGNLPTVAIDAPQPPCQVVFAGADNAEAGRVAGEGFAAFVQDEFNCEFDAYVSLDLPQLPDVNEARMGGMRAGFESVCGAIDDDQFISLDTGAGDGGPTENIRRQFADVLTTLPDAQVILVASVNDDSLLGAFAAAETAGAANRVYGAAHGADPSSWSEIRDNPNWVGDVAYFPERYGELVVAALVAIARGEEVPPEVFVDHLFVTGDTIDELYPESRS